MARIKVLELIDRPSLGGGPTAVLLLAGGLDPAVFETAVSAAGRGPLAEEAGKAGVRYLPFRESGRLNLRQAAAIGRVLDAEKPDILHTHGGFAGLYGRLAARRARTPIIVHTLHGIHYLHYRNPALRLFSIWQERQLSRTTDALVLVCRSDLARAAKYRLAAVEKLVAIANGLDLGPGGEALRAPALRRELGLDPGAPVVGTVARLHRQKGIGHLLRAAPRILEAVPEARIVVVGDGPQGAALRTQAGALGLGRRFLFMGERENARSLMSEFDVFVLPSLWEGLPFVLIEAAALGKPIVASAVDGVPEMIADDRTGILVPPADAGALAEAVISLLSDKSRAARLAAAARTLIPPRFPLRRTIEQHQDLYLRLYRQKISGESGAPSGPREPV